MALGGGEGGWWPAADPVRFYDTWEGRQSLGTSQLKKKSTRAELTEEGGWRCSGTIPAWRRGPSRQGWSTGHGGGLGGFE
jgi:hypothetical protein